jgi:predicted acyltransferase
MSQPISAGECSGKRLDSINPSSSDQSRLVTLDALRGFALCISFISDAMVPALKQVPPSAVRDAVAKQLTHSPWDGMTLVDIGWPAYLCMTGIALNYSISRRISQGVSKFSIFLGVLRKSLLCVLFAFFMEGGFSIPFAQIKFDGLFFRYALTILLAGTAHLLLGFRGVLTLVSLLFVGFSAGTVWAAQHYLGTTYQTPEVNLDLLTQQYSGSRILSRYLWHFPPALLCCLGGLLLAKVFQAKIPEQTKVWWLLAIGFGAINAAWMMDDWIQVNKRIWTTSFSLCAFGVTCLFLAAFHQIIEVWGIRSFKIPFVVFGANPLFAWVVNELVPFDKYAQRAIGYAFEPVLGIYNVVLVAAVQFTLLWLFFYWLYRNKLLFRIG